MLQAFRRAKPFHLSLHGVYGVRMAVWTSQVSVEAYFVKLVRFEIRRRPLNDV